LVRVGVRPSIVSVTLSERAKARENARRAAVRRGDPVREVAASAVPER
jgi:hypothetical protein